MISRKLLADVGLAMLIALPAVAPAEPSPRTVEAADALANQSAEPETLVTAIADRNREVRPGLGKGF